MGVGRDFSKGTSNLVRFREVRKNMGRHTTDFEHDTSTSNGERVVAKDVIFEASLDLLWNQFS